MEKNLALDISVKNQNEAIKYSKMVRSIWGNQTFSLELLKEAMDSLSELHKKCLIIHFQLDDNVNCHFSLNDLEASISSLKEKDKEYLFLTSSKIEFFRDSIESLLKQNKRILSNSLYYTELDEKFEKLPLDPRTVYALKRVDIITVNDLVNYGLSDKELLRIRGFGSKGLNDIKKILEPLGFKFIP